MWSQIRKAIDNGIEVEFPRNIESHQIEDIINAILDYTLLLKKLIAKKIL